MSSPDSMGLAIFVLATLPFLVVTALFLRQARKGAQGGHDASNWPVVTGEILVSDVRASTVGDGRSGGWYPDIAYAYSVGGHEYRGHAIAPGPEVGAGTRAGAAKLAARYPVGARVPVHYDPANPARAFLETGPRAGRALMWISGCIVGFVIFAAVAMWIVSQAVHRAVGGLL